MNKGVVAKMPKKRRSWMGQRGLMLMILPGLLCFFAFNYVPMAGIAIAFKDYTVRDGFFGSDWIGLDNFRYLFGHQGFRDAVANTFIISFLRLLFGFVAPIVLALMLNELRSPLFKRTVQTVTYLPYLMSWVILGGIFLLVFSSAGPVNSFLQSLRISPVFFLSDDVWFLCIVIATGIWQSVGYGAVIYLAALAGISPSLYEAASVDGANRWHQMRHITLPGLAPTILVLLILNLGHMLNAGFDQIYNLYNPLVYDVSDIIDTYVLRLTFNLQLGLSTAADLLKSVVGLFFLVNANYLVRRFTRGEQGIF